MPDYNTQQKKLIMPEYGRNVQQMIDHCVSIEDREERTRCANTIINIMGNLFPHLRDVDDFKHKLWDHLAIMSDFKLDIDYPYEIIRKENLRTKPDRIPYTLTPIRYRHYGKTLERMIKKCEDYPDGPERDQLISLLANHMKKSFLTWNKEVVDDDKIFKDLREYSHGKIDLSPETFRLKESKEFLQKKNKNNMRKAGR
ncbi:DUF4290 domain-containing protein [Coprobacter fastidiosus]|uniref:DUF4290 domain-containing protein n=1 Tax=Coprobacter fastidiosus TaxID=1099853 RepID=UPI000240E353|nr:DUF4290 domain-containing protein [Coprobacter fastidiosus]EHL88656.1 hypothetical protein HMPREF1033_00412 [Tannerella sp. 6_1_58FAA_CT1]